MQWVVKSRKGDKEELLLTLFPPQAAIILAF